MQINNINCMRVFRLDQCCFFLLQRNFVIIFQVWHICQTLIRLVRSLKFVQRHIEQASDAGSIRVITFSTLISEKYSQKCIFKGYKCLCYKLFESTFTKHERKTAQKHPSTRWREPPSLATLATVGVRTIWVPTWRCTLTLFWSTPSHTYIEWVKSERWRWSLHTNESHAKIYTRKKVKLQTANRNTQTANVGSTSACSSAFLQYVGVWLQLCSFWVKHKSWSCFATAFCSRQNTTATTTIRAAAHRRGPYSVRDFPVCGVCECVCVVCAGTQGNRRATRENGIRCLFFIPWKG